MNKGAELRSRANVFKVRYLMASTQTGPWRFLHLAAAHF